MNATTSDGRLEEVRIGRAEYLALVRDREVLDVIEADQAARHDGRSFRKSIGDLLDAGIPPNVIIGRASAAATRRAAERASLRSLGALPTRSPGGTANTSL